MATNNLEVTTMLTTSSKLREVIFPHMLISRRKVTKTLFQNFALTLYKVQPYSLIADKK
jgi:hypothetical protein